jgi:hypothetical protein
VHRTDHPAARQGLVSAITLATLAGVKKRKARGAIPGLFCVAMPPGIIC